MDSHTAMCDEGHRAAISDGITNTNAEAIMKEPEVNNPNISPFSIITPSSKTGLDDLGSGERKVLIPRGIHILRICLPAHSGLGLMIAAVIKACH